MSKRIKEQRRFKCNKPYSIDIKGCDNIIYYKIKTLSGYCAIATFGKVIPARTYESSNEDSVDELMLWWVAGKIYTHNRIKFI